MTIGDIAVTPSWVVTPNGTFTLRRTTWITTNNTVTETVIPAWAIVMAILFFVVCLLGLLFLLVKEQRTSGWVQVSVQGDGSYHATQIPVSSPLQIAEIEQRVGYVRSLVAGLG